MKTFEETLSIGIEEIPCRVTFDFWRGFSGSFEEPPEEPGIDILNVYWKDTNFDILPALSNKAIEEIEAMLWKIREDSYQSAMEERADSLYEQQRERKAGLL